MNERIKELGKQLKIVDPEGKFYSPNYEVFAELIVRECAGIVDQPYDFKTPPDQRMYRYPLSGQSILKHFGVEDERTN